MANNFYDAKWFKDTYNEYQDYIKAQTLTEKSEHWIGVDPSASSSTITIDPYNSTATVPNFTFTGTTDVTPKKKGESVASKWINPCTGEKIPETDVHFLYSGTDEPIETADYPVEGNLMPWEEEGVWLHLPSPWGYQGEESKQYDKEHHNINLPAAVAHFYLLESMHGLVLPIEAMNSGIMPPPIGALPRLFDYLPKADGPLGALLDISEEAHNLFEELCDYLAPQIEKYLHYAISTEIRVNAAVQERFGADPASKHVWNMLPETFGYEATARWAAAVFRKATWSGGWGGEPWAGIADCAERYARGSTESGAPFGKREFLDQAFSLEHNGGCAFNKAHWPAWNSTQSVLEAHYQGDIETLWTTTKYVTNTNNNNLASYDELPMYVIYEKLKKLKKKYIKAIIAYRDAMPDKEPEPVPAPPEKINVTGVTVEPEPEPVGPTYKTPEEVNELLSKINYVPSIDKIRQQERESDGETNSLPRARPGFACKKIMASMYDGECKLTGKTITAGDMIVYHGRGKGASLLTEYETTFRIPKAHQ